MILLHFMKAGDESGEYVTFLEVDRISNAEAREYARPGFVLEGAWMIEPERALSSGKVNFLPGEGDVYMLDR